MVYRSINNLLTAILFILTLSFTSYCQLIYKSTINTSLVSNNKYDCFYKTPNDLYVTFKRGTGTSALDNQIKLAISHDGGIHFIEKDITIQNIAQAYDPTISGNSSTVYVMYLYKDASNVAKMCAVTVQASDSTSFSNSTIYLAGISGKTDYTSSCYTRGGMLCFDGSTFYLSSYAYLFSSSANCNLFNQITSFPVNHQNFKIAVSSQNIWMATFYDDSLGIYFSSNGGTSFGLVTRLFVAGSASGANYTISSTSTYCNLAYVDNILNQYYLRYTRFTSSGLIKNIIVDSSANAFGSLFVWGNGQDTAFIGDESFYGISRSLDNGQTWKGPSMVNAELPGFTASSLQYMPSVNSFYAIGNLTFLKWTWTNPSGTIKDIQPQTRLEMPTVRYSASKLYITSSFNGAINILNIKGQSLFTYQSTMHIKNPIYCPLISGLYFLKLSTGNSITFYKLVVL